MPNSLEKQQSVVLDALRFPLIVLILYMHIVPIEHFDFMVDDRGMMIYNFIAEFISHNVGRLAVPCFFMISGYFYFKKMEYWSSSYYFSQQKKRLKTLIIPYIIWNLLNIAVILVKGYLWNCFGKDGNGDLQYIHTSSFWDLMTYPVDQPLWYLRDLICMTFVSPLFYFLFKYLKQFGLILLLGIYLSTLEIGIRGFSMTAILFFGIGSFWALNNRNIVYDSISLKKLTYLMAPILAILATVMCKSPYYEFIIRLFVPFGVISAICISNSLIHRETVKATMLKLSGSVFFIYAVHELYLKSWVKGAFFSTPLANSGWGMIFGYFVMPIILLGICYVLYLLFKLYLPRTLALLTGGRVSYTNVYAK